MDSFESIQIAKILFEMPFPRKKNLRENFELWDGGANTWQGYVEAEGVQFVAEQFDGDVVVSVWDVVFLPFWAS